MPLFDRPHAHDDWMADTLRRETFEALAAVARGTGRRPARTVPRVSSHVRAAYNAASRHMPARCRDRTKRRPAALMACAWLREAAAFAGRGGETLADWTGTGADFVELAAETADVLPAVEPGDGAAMWRAARRKTGNWSLEIVAVRHNTCASHLTGKSHAPLVGYWLSTLAYSLAADGIGAFTALYFLVFSAAAQVSNWRARRGSLAAALADVVHTFRPCRGWLPEYHTADATALARTLYDTEDRSLKPVLADALGDAGCPDTNAAVRFLRDPALRFHRGCWVVDKLTGRA